MTDVLLLVCVVGVLAIALAVDLAAVAAGLWRRRQRDLDCRPKCCVAAN